jgi:hypothetical protein
MWHAKEPSLPKAVSAKHKSKSAALSLLMVTTARQLKSFSCSHKHIQFVAVKEQDYNILYQDTCTLSFKSYNTQQL